MRKKVIIDLAIICSALTATGCSNAIPELTQEQQELVVEYAAGAVLRHDKNYESKLVELTLEETQTEESEAVPIPEPEMAEPEAADVAVIDNTETAETVYSIESFLQLDTVSITYEGYDIDDFYPNENESEDLYFVMNATEGNKLLVLKFKAENISNTETELAGRQNNIKFKIDVNGVEKNALTTLLPNDLAYYQGTIAAGESTELVLVCEIADQLTEEISSLSLIMKSEDDTATISLN